MDLWPLDQRLNRPLLFACGSLAATVLSGGCRPKTETAPLAPVVVSTQKAVIKTDLYRPRVIGEKAKAERAPWIAHVNTADLDGDGRLDVVACEAQENQVLWIRQRGPDQFEETVIGEDMHAPVRAEVGDLDGDGDLDLIVSSMGVVFPNNDRIGRLYALENLGGGRFAKRMLLEGVARVVDARAVDLNGDGKMDLAVAQFGYDQGEVRVLVQVGPWQYQSQKLLDLSGAMNVCVGDFTGDGLPDLAVQFSQQWEEIYLFENVGQGAFRNRRIWGSSNEDYGSSGMVAADLDRDGRLDLVFTNGDGFGPAVVPGPRAYHGVQWLRNAGNGAFTYRRIGDANGAYSPAVGDLDGDGRLDVALVAAFIEKDGQNRPVPSLVLFRNQGGDVFEKQILAYEPQHQVTLALGDFSREGRLSLVTGGFYVFNTPPNLGRVTLWKP